MLGEPKTEQFEVVTEVDGETVHRLKIHDPFIRTTTTIKGFGAAWKCLFGLSVTTRVNGSHGAMSAVMMLDPVKLAEDSHRLSHGVDANTAALFPQKIRSVSNRIRLPIYEEEFERR